METLQIRLSKGLRDRIDAFVKTGIYANRSDVVRDAVRRLVWNQEVGTVPFKGSGVKLVRQARDKLSKEPVDLNELNKL